VTEYLIAVNDEWVTDHTMDEAREKGAAGRAVIDGPHVETKEHLRGFAVVDVPDDPAAPYRAGRLAVALDWPQAVHRFPGRVRVPRGVSEERCW
jgi:hypothetical protein